MSLLVKCTVPAVAGGGVVELVLGRHREVERDACRGAARRALTTKWVAAAALTVMVLLTAVMLLVAVSVAVSVWLPAVLSVTLKVPTPLVSVAVGRQQGGAVSLLVKCTVPAVGRGGVVELVLGRDREVERGRPP